MLKLLQEIEDGDVCNSTISNINGKIIISKGEEFSPDIIKYLKIWGITEVDVFIEDKVKKETTQKGTENIATIDDLNSYMRVLIDTAEEIKNKRYKNLETDYDLN